MAHGRVQLYRIARFIYNSIPLHAIFEKKRMTNLEAMPCIVLWSTSKKY